MPPQKRSSNTKKTAPKKAAAKKPRKKSAPNAARNKRLWLWIGSAVAVVVAAILIFFLPVVTKGAPEEALIRIPANASRDVVRDSLVKYLGPSYTHEVMKMASLRGSDFSRRHGAYLITKGLSPLRAERKLSQGAQQPLTLTINGFRTLPTLAERVSRRFDFTPKALTSALSDPDLLRPYGLTPEQALSLFIDDSYELYWSATPEDVIKKVGENYKKVWNAERISKASGLGLTPAQVMTVCSIVDEESNKIDDKGKIGRLYINRINKGMPLQADPTIRFALNDFTIRRVKGAHLKVDSPYNTYRNKGLPPGPIRTTSLATIDAVLNSAPSDYLYMCAKDDFSGYHSFASTYQQHLENARRYQRALDNRGIK